MIRRPRRSIPATTVAVVMLVAAVLVAVSCVQLLLAQAPLLPLSGLAGVATTLTPSSAAVIAAAVIIAVIGTVLLLAALLPGSPVVLAVGDADTGIDTGIDRRGLERALTHAAGQVAGVNDARVRAGRRSVTATVTTAQQGTARHDSTTLRAAVAEALDTRLTDLSPEKSPRVRVRLNTTSRSS